MGPEGRFTPEYAAEFKAPVKANPGGVGVLESPMLKRKINYEAINSKVKFNGWPSSFGIKETQYFSNGSRISARPEVNQETKRSGIPDDTEIHEATHAVVAEVTDGEKGSSVRKVTDVPGPGYNGLTELTSKNPLAAIAPYSVGHSGTGHDERITSFMTNNVDSAAKVARSIVRAHEEEIFEVASDLHDKGTMNGLEVKEAMDRVDEKKEINFATIFVKNPDGSEEQMPHAEVKNGIVIMPKAIEIPNKSHELSKEGIIFSRN
ncbi:MAG: hypothetical protein A2687_06020 [Candidatus Levybacteria bacterium RIFCSPHIGHO2_01_FULL_38_26]|nr:MAG: hypothetical protein A2687_06020 [Candidatus Levybacteria bacterium RIFCSPHIGHO2_01_FULL_38_26]